MLWGGKWASGPRTALGPVLTLDGVVSAGLDGHAAHDLNLFLRVGTA